MRVLQLASAFAYTGPAEPMLALSLDLKRLGHDVMVGHDTVRPGGNEHEEGMGPRVAASGLPVASDVALCTQAGPLTWLKDRAALRRHMTAVDVVHVHLSHDHALAVAARGRAGRPVIIRSVHALRSLQKRVGQAWMLRQCDALLVHSGYARSQAVEVMGLPSDHVHVVPGAVDLQRFHPEDRAARAATFRAQHNLPPGGPVVLMVAIFQAGRGQEDLLSWWPAVRAQLPDAQLWFAGLGEERERIMGSVKDLPGVHFLGYVGQDLPDAYAAADVSVLLREGNDGYGRAALESLASGTPVLTHGDAHAVVDVVTSSRAGSVVGDLSNGAPALVELLRAAPALRPLARQHVEAHHTQDSVTRLTLSIYARALSGTPS